MKLNFSVLFIFLILFTSCNSSTGSKSTAEADSTTTSKGQIIHLTKETFRQKVFDFDKREYKYNGEKPCIVEFFATWCGPCKMLSPELEELAKDYSEKINIYKIDIDEEHDLAAILGISSIPAIFFFPQHGQPTRNEGFVPKASLDKAIHELLLKNDTLHDNKRKI